MLVRTRIKEFLKPYCSMKPPRSQDRNWRVRGKHPGAGRNTKSVLMAQQNCQSLVAVWHSSYLERPQAPLFPSWNDASEGECTTQRASSNISFWKHYQPLLCRFVSFPLPAIRELQGKGAVPLRSEFTQPAPFCSELHYSHTSKGKGCSGSLLVSSSRRGSPGLLLRATAHVKHTSCFPTGKCSL